MFTGETLPQYRDLLVRTVLVGARDQEGFVRASSLSNLGDICKLLRFSLGNIVHEVSQPAVISYYSTGHY